jgi:hypothetical protein
MKRLLVVAACVGSLVSGPGMAVAGEVKGPPGTLNNTNATGAPSHANSACAFSGLNDLDEGDPVGQMVSQVQTAADSWKYYGVLQP